MINCPNCGAPFKSESNTCDFCGTSYFDFSCIDFENHKPIYLKIKINIGGRTAYITQKCIPRLGGISFESETADITDGIGNCIKKYVTNTSVITDVSFEAMPSNRCEPAFILKTGD